jgi:putative NIF3 family GTP cyclohydrolase 1 type 2
MYPIDVTARIGPLLPIPDRADWPMYSYHRPADIFWQGVADRLQAAGWREARIRDWLQSKAPRLCLDGTWGERLAALGAELIAAEERLPPLETQPKES